MLRGLQPASPAHRSSLWPAQSRSFPPELFICHMDRWGEPIWHRAGLATQLFSPGTFPQGFSRPRDLKPQGVGALLRLTAALMLSDKPPALQPCGTHLPPP